jgi:DNA repair and recombination protein RAD54B
MAGRPFKPPLLLNRTAFPNIHAEPEQPPKKKRRISDEDSDTDATTAAAAQFAAAPKRFVLVKTFIPHRVPLKDVGNTSQEKPAEEKGNEAYYTVLWRKFTMKKNKTWDGDGVLSIVGGYARLQNIDGREMGKIMWKAPLLPGSELSVGGKDVEVDSVISKEDYMAGKPFLGGKPVDKPAAPVAAYKAVKKRTVPNGNTSDGQAVVLPAASQTFSTKFKKHVLQRTSSKEIKKEPKEPMPRHDPNTPGALVMTRPKSAPRGKQIVDVVLDPLLGRHLRPHQRKGVQFMYECVMGMRESGEGAILADEMGLGKTLQTIALLWTLLKQNPVFEEQPVIKKAMIVCPVTLINNWRREFKKWLGLDRIGVFVVDNDKKIRLTDFTMGKAYSIMIIGYEKLRTVQDDLKKGAPIDIVIADEGHRLKTAQNKSAQAIKALNTDKRIILSGTPLQNDLSEFYTMVDFVNPALLGKYSTFKREFETPILQSRVPNATERNIEKGTARSEELARLTGQFILRRTSEVIAKFLPPKTEIVLFIQPTSAQAALYRAVVGSPIFGAVLGSTDASLQLINYLKKLCNSPTLLTRKSTTDSAPSQNVAALLESIPSEHVNAGQGAKLQVLDDLLQRIKATTDDKIVLVSNYTSTLDILGQLLTASSLPFLRLDGSTPAAKRQGLVDRFNNSSSRNYFAFLLSAKAGGTGLNLIGASRLILFDVDWNPATDLQAMARIHRDGQKKPCYIYRFLIKGAIDEKIFQRQVTKTGLADAVVDSKKTGQHFTHDELRDLFRLDEGEPCQSREYL